MVVSVHFSIQIYHSIYFYFQLTAIAVESGQNLEKIAFKDQSWLGLKTRSRESPLLLSALLTFGSLNNFQLCHHPSFPYSSFRLALHPLCLPYH